MGLEPFLIAASVRGLMAQRLVRRLCTHCSEPDTSADEALPALLQRFSLTPTGLRRAVGCPQCNGTGFHGRIAIYDLIEIDSDLSHQIATGAIESALLNRIGPQAHAGLLRSGMQLVAEGRTTLAEVLRATAGA
jgi:general secretion pathway protein E